MPGKAPAHIHMVCESCSPWHFYEGYVYAPFIFILLVLIAVSCTLLLCVGTTRCPATVPAVVYHMALLASDRSLLLLLPLPDHNSWKYSALNGMMTQPTGTGTDWVDSLGEACDSSKPPMSCWMWPSCLELIVRLHMDTSCRGSHELQTARSAGLQFLEQSHFLRAASQSLVPPY